MIGVLIDECSHCCCLEAHVYQLFNYVVFSALLFVVTETFPLYGFIAGSFYTLLLMFCQFKLYITDELLHSLLIFSPDITF